MRFINCTTVLSTVYPIGTTCIVYFLLPACLPGINMQFLELFLGIASDMNISFCLHLMLKVNQLLVDFLIVYIFWDKIILFLEMLFLSPYLSYMLLQSWRAKMKWIDSNSNQKLIKMLLHVKHYNHLLTTQRYMWYLWEEIINVEMFISEACKIIT